MSYDFDSLFLGMLLSAAFLLGFAVYMRDAVIITTDLVMIVIAFFLGAVDAAGRLFGSDFLPGVWPGWPLLVACAALAVLGWLAIAAYYRWRWKLMGAALVIGAIVFVIMTQVA